MNSNSVICKKYKALKIKKKIINVYVYGKNMHKSSFDDFTLV